MNKIFGYFALIILLLPANQLFGQTPPKPHDKKTIHLAKEFFRVEEYGEAVKLYEQLSQEHPENNNFKFYLGVCYFKLGNKNKAVEYFSQVRDKDGSEAAIEFNYYIAKSFQLAHHFDDALESYKTYLDTLKNTKTPDKYEHKVAEIEKEIDRCNHAIELMKKPQEANIINLSNIVNTEYHEYMPVISMDETTMMFTSRRPNTTGGGKDPTDGLWYEDIYMVTKKDSVWGEPQNMGNLVNTANHDATVCLSADGQKLFIYRSQVERLSSIFNGDIYVSELKNGSWSSPAKVTNNVNSQFWEPSASISATEDKFFFSSNRPIPGQPNRKDRDIYMVTKKADGSWSEAKNLGDVINTTDEDDAPFFHPDGRTLYFSSNGRRSVGGFDIFKTTYNDSSDSWTEPENIGFPFNTAGDDIYIEWSADGKRAYFSSARDDSYGGQDIYMATNFIEKHSMSMMIGRVFDADTKKPLIAEIIVTDNETDQIVGVFKSEGYAGKFSIALPSGKNYGVDITKDGYLFHSENVQLPHMAEYSEFRKDIYLHPFKMGASEILKNVFFDTDKSELRQESKGELDKLYNMLKGKSNLHVQISGHTDDKASHEYNHVLSEARAVSVVEYLIEQGMDRKKVLVKGYGETVPIASNDTEEGRQLNRRTEFMILDTEDDSHSKYLSLKDSTIIRPGDERYNLLMDDFKALFIKQQAEKAPVVGQHLFYQVHFPFNQSKSITEYSTNRLKAMLGFLEHYPKAKIHIISHADFFGDEKYNLNLCAERAQTVYDYLTSNGLDKSRVRLSSSDEQTNVIRQDNYEGNQKARLVEFLVESIK